VGTHAAASSKALGDDPTFKTQLDGSIFALTSAKSGTSASTSSSTTASTATTAATSIDAELQQQIEQLLDAGTAPADVATKLASSLASSVASALGISTDAAKAKLTSAFDAAMSAANTGPPQTNVERASALVTRFRQLAELATRVTNGDPGQPIRLIAGKSSDAEQAGATPAPTPDSILRDALAALAGSASPSTTAQAATSSLVTRPVTAAPIAPTGDGAPATVFPVRPVTTAPVGATSASGGTSPSAPTASTPPVKGGWDPQRPVAANPIAPAPDLTGSAGDGRSVAADPATLVATGGETTVGRILARATLAAPATTAAVQTAANTSTSTTTAPAAPATSAAPVTATTTATNATVATTASVDAAASAAAKTVEAFTQAFGAALARTDATSGSKDANPSASPAIIPTTSTGFASLEAAGGLAGSTTHDATAIAPPAPAATLPQTQQVDANAIVEQVLQGVSLRTSDGSSTVRLRLVPDSLGDVSVKLTVTGGSVDASITASTPAAQSALQGGQAQLARTLADSGLKLQSFTVGLGTGSGTTGNDSQGSDAQSRSRTSSTRRVGAVSGNDDADADDSSQLGAQIGPPIYTASTPLGALNYLA